MVRTKQNLHQIYRDTAVSSYTHAGTLSVDKLKTTPVLTDEDFGTIRHKPLRSTKISDFQILKPISRGAFGAVYLVRKKVTGDLYAVKVINKIEMMQARPKQVQGLQLADLQRKRSSVPVEDPSSSAGTDDRKQGDGTTQQQQIDAPLPSAAKGKTESVVKSHIAIAVKIRDAARERNIMSRLHNPFVVPLVFSFQSSRNLFLVMPFMPGGDLHSLLKNLGCLEEHICCQYASEIVLALRYLHQKGVIHRDLKPDNCLIDHQGHIKLTDFGLSEQAVTRRTRKMMEQKNRCQRRFVQKDGLDQWLARGHRRFSTTFPHLFQRSLT